MNIPSFHNVFYMLINIGFNIEKVHLFLLKLARHLLVNKERILPKMLTVYWKTQAVFISLKSKFIENDQIST